MKKACPTIVLLFALITAWAQDTRITTFVLVRHAEKASDGTRDPELSDEGSVRAKKLAALFEQAGIDAVYTTNYKRTWSTVAPLAAAKGLDVRTYEPANTEAIEKMLDDHAGQTVLVCGHSNTIPAIANHLLGRKEFADFDESDYGNILLVTVAKDTATAMKLRF